MKRSEFKELVLDILDAQFKTTGFCYAVDYAWHFKYFDKCAVKVDFSIFFNGWKSANGGYYWEKNQYVNFYEPRKLGKTPIDFFPNPERVTGILLWEQHVLDTKEYKKW